MKFENYVSAFETLRRHLPGDMNSDEIYRMWLEEDCRGKKVFVGSEVIELKKTLFDVTFGALTEGQVASMRLTLAVERDWYREVRPYYKLWPAIHQALLKIPLDIKASPDFATSERVFAIRLQSGNVLQLPDDRLGNYCLVDSVLVATTRKEGPGTIIIMPQGVSSENGRRESGRPMTLWLNENITFDECIETGCVGIAAPESIKSVMQIVIGVLLMAKDPRLVMADVLSKDRRKYEETGDPKYIEKARKRGVVGWNIGKKYETCPHYRRPHFGIRHTGKGGKIPRIVPIKGAVVHNKKLTTVPTGYITPNGVEVEPQNQ